jgi:hypothetical protein
MCDFYLLGLEIELTFAFNRAKKIKREPDPSVIQSLEHKLATMVLSANPMTSQTIQSP